MSLISELQRRNVFRVALLYAVASWLIVQVADVLFEQLGLPGWAFRFVFGLLVICFPLVLLFSWIFEITPEGIRREKEIAAEESITHQTGQRINTAIVVLLVLAIVTVVIDRVIPESAPESARPAPVAGPTADERTAAGEAGQVSDKSIAVLPFVNMSGDEQNEYFSDGLTEELLNALARIEELKVAGRTSSFAFKGKNLDLREIARQLDVAHLLEGSVRKAGNRVRITAQLIKASDGYHLWTDTFDRELDDIWEIQEEIAERVASALQARLFGHDSDALITEHTGNPEAWESYLRGKYLFQRAPDDEETQQRAEAEFMHALNLDPQFALARWGLFWVADFRHRNGTVDYDAGKQRMAAIAARMMKEAPELPQTHLARGRAAITEIDLAGAREAYRRAYELNPGDVEVLLNMGQVESLGGNHDRALRYLSEALAQDPLSVQALVVNAAEYMYQRRCEDIERLRDRVLTIEPEAGRINAMLGFCLLMTTNDAAAASELAEAEPVAFLRQTLRAIAWHRLGDADKAQAALDSMQADFGDSAAYQYGQVYANWGDPERAVEWLNVAWDTGDPGILNMRRDPVLDPLREDPAFLTLQRKWSRRAGL